MCFKAGFESSRDFSFFTYLVFLAGGRGVSREEGLSDMSQNERFFAGELTGVKVGFPTSKAGASKQAAAEHRAAEADRRKVPRRNLWGLRVETFWAAFMGASTGL